MRPPIDETGHTYGEWTVIKRAGGDVNARWLCQCSCGRTSIISGTTLRTGMSRSCGKCGRNQGYVGMQIGHWTILEDTPLKRGNSLYYHAACKCGRERYMRITDMKRNGYCADCKRESMIIDETGHRYGHLTVIKRCERPKFTSSECKTWWLCKCDCGAEVKATGSQLRLGQRKSCGCRGKGINDCSGEAVKGGNCELFQYQKAQ